MELYNEVNNITKEQSSKRVHFFNPLAMILVMMVLLVLAFTVKRVEHYSLICFSLCICLINTRKKIIKVISMIIFLYAVPYLLLLLFKQGSFIGFLLILFNVGIKMIPVSILLISLSSYTASELTSAFRYFKISEKIAIIVSIFYRYLPEFKSQMKAVRNGAKSRGLSFNILNPLRSFEQLIVPILYRGLHVADAITGSMITKGATYKGKKSNYRNIIFLTQDYIILLMTFLILGGLVWKNIF